MPYTATGREAITTRHHVEVFTTAARLADDGAHWMVPVHAWVYTPQHSRVRKAALAAILLARLGLEASAATVVNFDRRANLLFADNNRDRRVRVRIAGHGFDLPPTAPNGHARGMFAVARHDIDAHASGHAIRIDVELPAHDQRRFGSTSLLVPTEGISVISDIDDTVKISHVTDRARLMDATFFRDFEVVPGMAALFTEWARSGAVLHFVSSSPWHLYAPLREMLNAAGMPAATLDLKQIRLKDATIFDLFKDATKTKPPAIDALLAAYPHRRFVLVGDSGELDPEIYATIVRRHPHRIVQILIRNVTAAAADDARFTAAFAGLDRELWQLFDDPSEIRWRTA